MADENRIFELKTKQVFLNFLSLVPTSLDSHNDSIYSDSQYGTPRSSSDDGKADKLTVIKKDKKLLAYRTSSSSSASSSTNSQQSCGSSFKKSMKIAFDGGDCPKENECTNESLPIEEFKTAYAYIDISDQECDDKADLRKEITNLKNEVKDELKNSTGNPNVMFDNVDGSEDGMEIAATEAGIKLRAVADKFNEQHCQEINSLVDRLIAMIRNDPPNFRSSFVSEIASLVRSVGTGLNAVALIFSIAQRIVSACTWSLSSVMEATLLAVRTYEGEDMRREGWNIIDETGVEFVGSAVDGQ